nr:zinc finger protein 624 [Aedes albopictus]
MCEVESEVMMNPTSIKVEVPDPPLAEPEFYCRFCYSTEELVSIFPAKGDPHQQVIDLLKQLTTIELTVLDDLPSAICSQCCSKLEEFDHFRKQCLVHYEETKRARLTEKVASVEQEEDTTAQQHEMDVEQGGLSSMIDVESVKVEPIPVEVPSIKKTSKSVKQLKKERSSQLRDYRCRICLLFLTSKDAIKNHLHSHIDVERLQCLHCSKLFRNRQGLDTHMRTCYILSSFMCQNCDLLFNTKEELCVHENGSNCVTDVSNRETEPPRLYQCELCPKSFSTAKQLSNHKPVHSGAYACDKCGSNFHSSSSLKNHIERYHSLGLDEISTIVRCEPCQQTFVDATAYRGHCSRIHQHENDQKPPQLQKGKPFECDHCGKRFWSINTIRVHVQVHRQYRDCNQCSESFRTVQQLKKHKLIAHPEKCPFCPKKYSCKQACRSHCNVIHGMIQIKLLDEHQAITYEWRKLMFKCAVCDKDYETFRDLKGHYEKKHPGDKVLIKCVYCQKHTSASKIGYAGHVTGNCGQTPKKLKYWH